jgi:hypothetical protein
VCRDHPHIYHLAVKLVRFYNRLLWSFRIPAAALMRKCYCIYVDHVAGLPVYLDKCDADIQAGLSLFESSFRYLEEKSPIWGKRVRRLFGRIIITKAVDVAAYAPEQRCCYVNPWEIIRAYQKAKLRVHSSELARFIIYITCTAYLWEHHAAFLSREERKELSNKAQVRFLLRCLDIPKDAHTLGKIRAARTVHELLEFLGITKDDAREDPSIIDILSGIQTVQKRTGKARAARGNRLWSFIREANSLPQ